MFPTFDWEIDIDGTGEKTLATPPSGRKVKLGMVEFTVSVDATVNAYFGTDEAANRVLHITRPAGDGLVRPPSAWFRPGPIDGVLKIAASAGSLTGHAGGWYI